MTSAASAATDHRWARIGRDAELRAARAGLSQAGVVVCSRWGLGGSAFARSVAPRPWARLVVDPSQRDEPLFGVRRLLDDGDDAGDAHGVTDRLRTALRRVGGRPVLVVDGWSNLDRASMAVLLHLLGMGALRLLGVREDPRPVSAATSTAWRELGLVRVDLEPLADEASSSVLDELLEGSIEGRTRRDLLALAAGNPGLLVEFVSASTAGRVLVSTSGLWKLTGPPVLSPTVIDLARAALDELDAGGRSAAEVLAIAGPLPLTVLDAVTDPSGAETLERAGLARARPDEGGGATLALVDPVLTAHLTEAVPLTARLRITGALAVASEDLALASDPDLFVRSAEWSLAAGRPADPRRLLDAARAAIDLGDPGRAERLASASSQASPTTEAVLLESWCADECGAIDRSERVLADHRPLGDEAVVAVAIRRSEQQFWTHRDPVAAYALLDDAASQVSAPWDDAIAAQAAMFDLIAGRSDRALAAARPLADHPTRLVRSTASLASALALVMDDRPVEAAEVADEALARLAGSAPGLAIDPGVHIISLCFSYDGQGRWNEAGDLTEAVYGHALSRPGRQAQGWAALVRARVLTALGRPAAAAAVALEAEQIWRSANLAGVARWSATVAGQAFAQAGDAAEAAECLARIGAEEPTPFGLFEPEVARLRAWHAALSAPGGPRGTGVPPRDLALEELAEASRAAALDGRRHLAALAAFDLVRLGDGVRGALLLAQLVERGASATTQLRAQTADAVVAGDADRLESLASRWEVAGAVGTAAECLALAAAARPARTAFLGGRIEALTTGTGLQTPPLRAVGVLQTAQQLTPREREIVSLVAEGLSNRAIADQLVLSNRTVENHLHRAYAKLGIASRAELVAPSAS